MRSVILRGFVLLCAGLLGCGGSGNEKSGGKSVGSGNEKSGGKSVGELRKELRETAKQMEGPFAEVVETFVGDFESGSSGWSWSMLDDKILMGRYTVETKAAYQRWRHAKIAADKNKKK
jgi:hypothetical protein